MISAPALIEQPKYLYTDHTTAADRYGVNVGFETR